MMADIGTDTYALHTSLDGMAFRIARVVVAERLTAVKVETFVLSP